MAVEAILPTIGLVTVTAAIDSINPCAIGVLILMLSVLLSNRNSIRRMIFLGSIYIAAVYVTYLLAGLGLLYFLSIIPLYVTEYIAIIVGTLIIAGALFEIKDFFWYGRGFSLSIPARYVKKIHDLSAKTTLFGIIMLGAFVSAVELPCTGGPYLALITLLSQYFDFNVFLLLVYYNIIFVAPLVVILVLVALGKKLYTIKRWKQANRGYMRLLLGLLLIGMGWLLILIANGTINFG